MVSNIIYEITLGLLRGNGPDIYYESLHHSINNYEVAKAIVDAIYEAILDYKGFGGYEH